MPPDPLALAILFLSTLSLRRATQITVMQATDAMPFLSTLSLRRATTQDFSALHHIFISIHALLAESDESQPPCARPTTDFYPRSPCGERHWPGLLARPFFLISIHALLAESDERANGFADAPPQISIHALLAESDCWRSPQATMHT